MTSALFANNLRIMLARKRKLTAPPPLTMLLIITRDLLNCQVGFAQRARVACYLKTLANGQLRSSGIAAFGSAKFAESNGCLIPIVSLAISVWPVAISPMSFAS